MELVLEPAGKVPLERRGSLWLMRLLFGFEN